MEVPTRTCVACRQPTGKPSLIRLAAPHGTVQVDPHGAVQARGAYVCATPDCVEAALRREGAAITRALRIGRAAVDATALRTGLDSEISARARQATRHHREDEAATPPRGACT